METKILDNKLKIIYLEKETKSVCIEINVKAGSNDESEEIAGISHFIEHMIFEGTPKRPNSFVISNEIEKLGGELNAATSNERTFFYAKVLSKHFDIALDVLSDIVKNPLFKEEHIKKEKKIVIDEIKMVHDQPRYFQWVLFEKELFKKHPMGKPIYGNIDSIKNLSVEQISSYFKKYYVPNNMTIVVVGKVDNLFEKVKQKFADAKETKLLAQTYVVEPEKTENQFKTEKKGSIQAYVVLGYKTVSRRHDDSYVLDVVRAILGRGQSGKIFDEIRNKRGLAYDVGVFHNPNLDTGYFAVYVNTDKKNIDKTKDIIVDEIQKLKNITEEEIAEAKTFLEGEFLLTNEESQKMTDVIASWEQVEDSGSVEKYLGRIAGVTKKDISLVVDEYFSYYTMAVLE